MTQLFSVVIHSFYYIVNHFIITNSVILQERTKPFFLLLQYLVIPRDKVLNHPYLSQCSVILVNSVIFHCFSVQPSLVP
jgi:hypothetical protein